MANQFDTTTSSAPSLSLAANALVTLAELKRELQLTVNTYDDLLIQAINLASGYILDVTGQTYPSARIREFVDGNMQRFVVPTRTPITGVYRLATDRTHVMDLTYSGSAPAAWVQTDAEKMTTFDTAPDEYEFADSLTVAALVAAINGASTDWAATLVMDGDSHAIYPGAGDSVTAGGVVRIYAATGSAEVMLDPYQGQIRIMGSHVYYPEDMATRHLRGKVFIDYQAGLATVPQSLKLACLAMAGRMYYASSRDTSINSESMGTYSYTAGDVQSAYEAARSFLGPYMVIR